MGNHPELTYRGGQEPIVTLEADLYEVVAWAEQNGLRWAFTLSNAGSTYFEDRADLNRLSEIDWDAVATRYWSAPNVREGKQAEFLIEHCFPWDLVRRIGVYSRGVGQQVSNAMGAAAHRPTIEIMREWYY